MYLILYRCACEKRTTRDGTGGRSDRTGLDDSDVIIVVFMCKQFGCGGTCTVVYCEHRWCVRRVRVRVCLCVCPWCKSIIVVRAAIDVDGCLGCL